MSPRDLLDGRSAAMSRRIPAPGDEVVIRAWLRVGGPEPSAVEPVGKRSRKGNKKSVLYRLVGAGDGGAPVVAKLCLGLNAANERHMHEHVLPSLAIPLPRFYGALEATEGHWLFLEDAGAARLDRRVPLHREAAGRWLARLHAAGRHAPSCELPDRGPAHYLGCLQRGRRGILENRGNPIFDAEHREVLDAVAAKCDALEHRWPQIEEACADLPRCLVHGDFCAKNVHVREADAGPQIVPLDWEMAGWGIPAVDLHPGSYHKPGLADPEAYGGVMRESWHALDRKTLRQLVGLGRVFRTLAAVEWIGADLGLQWAETPISMLRIYRDELDIALRGREWAR